MFPRIINGTPKSSILIGFSLINHPFWGTPIFGNIHILPRFSENVDVAQMPLKHKLGSHRKILSDVLFRTPGYLLCFYLG